MHAVRVRRIILKLLSIAGILTFTGTAIAQKKEMAITFDELPSAQGFSTVDVAELNEMILNTLDSHEVKAAGFVVGGRIEEHYDILGEWLNRGHVLGNLTHSHQDLHALGIENFIGDIIAGQKALETMLSGFGQEQRYFRYPFLHYGQTVEAKREVSLYLEDKGIKVAHATVVVEDYLYNLSLENLGKNRDSADLRRLIDEYVLHLTVEVNRSERLAKEILKRRCRQILLLRANQLNALALDDVLTALDSMDYRFITVDRALNDDVYDAPDAYFGSRGMGYLDMILRAEPDLLPAE